MSPRSVLIATSVAVALLGAGQAGAATKHNLDGRRSRTTSYAGQLNGPAVPMSGTMRQQPLEPDIDDCTDQSCDVRELRLTLPRNVSSGRFHATVVVDTALQASLVLYNAKGTVLAQHNAYDAEQKDDFTYQLDVHVERLPRGQYTLALVDRAGTGNFSATLAWVAHPADLRIR